MRVQDAPTPANGYQAHWRLVVGPRARDRHANARRRGFGHIPVAFRTTKAVRWPKPWLREGEWQRARLGPGPAAAAGCAQTLPEKRDI